MSEVTIVRRRLAALEEAIAVLKREWGETHANHPVPVWMLDMAVTLPTSAHQEDDRTLLTIGDLVECLDALRVNVAELAEHVETYALVHGIADWHPIKDAMREASC